jgi:two-component system, NarL family, sensor histidine kinase DesK
MSRGWRVVGRALLASSSLVLVQAWLDVQQHPDVASGTSAEVLLLLVAMACVWSTYWLVTAGQASVALSIAAVGLLAALASATLLLLPARYFGLLIFASVLAGGALPKRLAVRAVAALTVLTVGLDLARSLEPVSIAIDALEVGVTGAGAVAVAFLLASYGELRDARDQVARLAVAEERNRLARDLHDDLGQRLSLIILKSELVRLDLPDGTPERLRANADDLVTEARAALDGLRTVVMGFHRPSIETELASAASILDSAGIAFECRNSLGPVPAPAADVLAWGIREGTTNVVRHSRAARCSIRLRRSGGHAELEVSDDGIGAQTLSRGNCLFGIEERATKVGGSVSATGTDSGFTLRLTVPIQ